MTWIIKCLTNIKVQNLVYSWHVTHTDRKSTTLASLLFLLISLTPIFHSERLKGQIIEGREPTFLQVSLVLEMLTQILMPVPHLPFAFSPTLALPGLFISLPSDVFFSSASPSAQRPLVSPFSSSLPILALLHSSSIHPAQLMFSLSCIWISFLHSCIIQKSATHRPS